MPAYLAYGLRIHSTIPLVGLSRLSDSDGAPDVTIERGPVLDRASNVPRTGSFEARPGQVFLWHPRAGAVLVRAGREMIAEPTADPDEGLLRSILLGQAFGALFLQRGTPTLHASAVAIGEEVVAFVGQKGDGKSTTAAALVAAGHAFVSDDLVAVTLAEGGEAVVAPGYGFLKLSPESAKAVEIAPDVLDAVADRSPKGRWALAPVSTSLPLRAIYELAYDESGGTETRVERLPTTDAFVTVTRHSFAGALAPEIGRGREHLQACTDLARGVPVYRVVRPRDLDRLSAVRQALEAHARSHPLRCPRR
jgi:hypothetical protein